MALNKTTFFAYVRKSPFGGRLTEQQVEGVESILTAWDARRKRSALDNRHLAYILATAFHETGGRMVPVREGFAKSDAAARKIVAKRKYGAPDPKTGEVYYGRGQVQLTWANNYKTMSQILGIDLYNEPDLALDPDIGAAILVEGMTHGVSAKGDFTGKAVEDYFNDEQTDAVGARAVINGKDKAALIATYYESFFSALEAADLRDPQPADVNPKDAEPDGKPLTKDKSTWGAITAVLGSGGAGILGAIDNPWAVLAVLIVGVGVLLFLTGRLELRRKTGA